MDSIGAKLRQARKAKNLTLEDVYQKTKIHLNTLKALEEDNFKSIGPSYVKGFLRLYAKFLGLNSNEIMGLYENNFPLEPKPQASKQEDKDSPKTSFPDIKLKSSFPVLAFKVLVVVVIFIVIAGLITFALKKIKKQARPKAKKSITFVPVSKKNASTKTSLSTPAQKIPSKINLVLRAKEDTWVQVSIDNHIVFRNVLKRAQVEAWVAKERAELSIGNAGGLDLEVNGKIISPLGRRGQVIKHIQITRESINIPR